jgi:hypothetical protein
MKNWILIAVLLSQVTLVAEKISSRKISKVNVYANHTIVMLVVPFFLIQMDVRILM